MSQAAARLEILTRDDLAEVLRELRALRLEVERLRVNRSSVVTFPEAARRLNVTLRSIQKWAKDGRLPVELVGGVRMVRLPEGVGGA